MEIYNEQAYDLLDQRHSDQPIENWNKVIHLSNMIDYNLKFLDNHI